MKRRARWLWLAPLPVLLAALAAAQAPFPLRPLPAERSENTVARLLASERNLSASPSDVHWLDPADPKTPFAFGPREARAWVLAQAPSQLNDVYFIVAELSPEGRVVRVPKAFNLTETSAADESYLVAENGVAAFITRGAGPDATARTYALHMLNAEAGAPVPEQESGWRELLQRRATHLQNTGQTRGVAHRVFKLDPPAKDWWMTLEQGELRAAADGQRLRIPIVGPPREGGRLVLEKTTPPARQGNLTTWAVDRVRAIRWFGDKNMQRVKAVAYRLLDFFDRRFEAPSDRDEDAWLSDLGDAPVERPPAQVSDGRVWPPPDLKPLLDPPFQGEGRWLSLEKDPFVRSVPGLGSTFYTTFIRPDPERKFSRVTIALWDPRYVELNMEGGTEEPRSATGDHGTGLIPRDPDVLRRLVGAFNGGFQGTHGDYGMHVDGVTYVPPRPYAATIAVLDDGSTAFGSWPNDAAIPKNIRSFRQNLTALIADGVLNPYGRLWWGGVPEGWEDDTRTVRSGLCLTDLGHVAYFYGAKVDYSHLAKAMLRAGCQYGVHLDMNQGHTGLEFYQVDTEEALPTLGVPLHPMWQAEGGVPETPGFWFRGRRLFRSMQLMNFPRYIQRGERDFFYLTLRKTLPPAPLTFPGATGNEGRWRTEAVGDRMAPPLLTTTTVRPLPEARPETKVHLLALDGARLQVAPAGDVTPAWLRLTPPPRPTADAGLWWTEDRVQLAVGAPSASAVLLATGLSTPRGEIRAAWGISSDRRIFLYAEVATAPEPLRDSELLEQALRAAGADQVLFRSEPSSLALSGEIDLSGHPSAVAPDGLRLVRADRPLFERIFKDVTPLPRSEWKAAQDRGFLQPAEPGAPTN